MQYAGTWSGFGFHFHRKLASHKESAGINAYSLSLAHELQTYGLLMYPFCPRDCINSVPGTENHNAAMLPGTQGLIGMRSSEFAHWDSMGIHAQMG
ncbi:MAG TPA: hypothetical protein DEA96_03640 [Leptospiraceae bacterium]|nr:hypothetical protein [Spirochaetaceae bacterium]HBS04033.1 hypothetical protein [Leptospiraceae bacterium]